MSRVNMYITTAFVLTILVRPGFAENDHGQGKGTNNEKTLVATTQTVRELQKLVVELQSQADLWSTLLIISGSINGLVIVIGIKILVTRRYTKSRDSKYLSERETGERMETTVDGVGETTVDGETPIKIQPAKGRPFARIL